MKLKQKIFESTIPYVGRVLRAYFRSPYLVQYEPGLEVKLMLKRSFSNILINKLPGDYFEFGLYQGRSFLYALESQQEARNWGVPIHCHGFDSFEGLSGIESSKDEFHNLLEGGYKFSGGQYACSLKEFNLILKEHAVSQDRYTLHKGFFQSC